MGWFTKHKQQVAGQPITARSLKQIADTADFAARIQAYPPLGIIAGSNGAILRYEGEVFDCWVGVTAGTITARSGSTPGSGPVTPGTWNGTSLGGGMPNVTAYNFSANPSTGIPAGKYCVVLRIGGDYFIISVEC